jgi:K+-sensing histidine kinase KdpD
MDIKNARRWSALGLHPYLMALAGYVLAFAARYLMQPVFAEHEPMLFFAINCTVVAYYYGFWPAFAILLISVPTAAFSFVPPYFSTDGLTSSDIITLASYMVGQTLVMLLLESLHRTRYQAELLARVAATRYQLLVEMDEDRRSAVKQLHA